MRILYHHRIASKDGQYVHVDELTSALKRLHHEVFLVAPPTVEERSFGDDSRLVSRMKAVLPAPVYELLELGYSIVDFAKLAALVARHKPDVIYERDNLYFPSGIWMSRLSKIPLLLEVNAPLFEERQRYNGIGIPWLARWSEDYAWRHASRVLPVTRALADRIRARGVPSDNIRVIPNGIDPAKFDHAPDGEQAKKALGLTGRLVLGFTGFVRDRHRLDRVLDVLLPLDNNRHLLVVGDGPARESILAQARLLGVSEKVNIAGIEPHHRVVDYVAAFDIALQPDVVDYASPLKLFEYLALGRAIVAPDKPNIREILTHEENAVLFDPEEPNSFRTATERLCTDDTLRKRVGEGARRTIADKELTWDHNARRVTALAEALLRPIGGSKDALDKPADPESSRPGPRTT